MESTRHFRLIIKLLVAVTLAAWVCVWILKPTQFWKKAWHVAGDRVGATFLGEIGLTFVVFCFPILAAAALVYAHLYVSSSKWNLRDRRTQLMTNFSQPILTNSPLGILSLGELLAMVFFFIFLAWTYYSNVSSDFNKMMPSKTLVLNRKQIKVMSLGVRFGSLSEACLAVLLLPILRRMALFRIVGIQFEASVRYHMWIANGMMLFSLLHGTIIMAVWYEKSSLLHEIIKWQRVGRVYLAGAITLFIGIIIWITSLPPIRRKFFQFFFTAHHLYLLFFFFFLLHAGDRHFYLVFSGVLLFALDKVSRIIQSRKTISLLSARILPCKAVELTLRKPPGLKYAPTSILFMKIPSISKFQWHPFSIISSSNDDERISIMVKCQGKWTNSLYEMMKSMANKSSDIARSVSVSVEGPYGPPNLSYRRYSSLILIAAGSGITPFLSILQDLSSRDCSLNPHTTKINLIFIVKKSEDLSMLNPVSTLLLNHPPEITPTVRLRLKIYVTQEQKSCLSARELINSMAQIKPFVLESISTVDEMPAPGGLVWSFASTGLSSIVFLITILCLNRAFIHEGKKQSKEKTPSWVSDLIVFSSFLITIISVSAITIVYKWRESSKSNSQFSRKNQNSTVDSNTSIAQGMEKDYEINFGRRPNLIDVLSEELVATEETVVGVFACGPDSMQESVATFCKNYSKGTKSSENKEKQDCSFVYHSINFSL